MALPISRKIVIGVFSLVLIVLFELYTFSLHFEARAKVLRAHFVVLVQIFLYLISRFLWSNLSHFEQKSSRLSANTDNQNTPGQPWTAWKTILLIFLILSHCSYVTNLFFLGRDPHWFSMITYCCLGAFFQLATALAIIKCLNFFLGLIVSRSRGDQRKTVFSKRVKGIIAILYSACAAYYGLTSAALVPNVKNVTIPIKDLSPRWDGIHIVQISDVHLGPTVGFTKLQRIVGVMNELKPDIVVMTGDLVDGTVDKLHEAAAPLSRIKSVYGKFFVTGNHEYYTGDVDNWFDHLKTLGFEVLHNSHVFLTPERGTEEDSLCLAGADDLDAYKMRYTGHGLDIDSSLRHCDPQKPVIMLAHQPGAAKQALQSKYRVDLILSGHTHGGQFFPLMIGAYFLNPFFAGLYTYGQHSHVYVSQGTQYWGIPIRLGSTMEITDITIRTALD